MKAGRKRAAINDESKFYNGIGECMVCFNRSVVEGLREQNLTQSVHRCSSCENVQHAVCISLQVKPTPTHTTRFNLIMKLDICAFRLV